MNLETAVGMRPVAPDRFEQFFRARYPEIVRTAWGIVRDGHLAEDVAQDVMLAVRQRFPDLDDAGHALAWARMATVHTALNAVRSRRRSAARHERVATGLQPVTSPEDVMIDREDEAAVRQALSRLPLHAATVLVLRHSGLTYSEIARVMAVKVGHVGTMLRRAEAALRKEMARATRA